MTSVSNFFSRDAMLKRQARTVRARRIESVDLCRSASLQSRPLNIIAEEDDEPRASSSRSPSPYTATSSKAKRRHAQVAHIRIAGNDDFSYSSDNLLTAPRPAPRPPTTASSSPQPSPDSFRLTFTDKSYTFPHPPIPTPSSLKTYAHDGSESPTLSISMDSLSSSPCSQLGGMPLTPSSSDDEFAFSSPRFFNPRRAAIQPLTTAKHYPGLSSPVAEALLHPSKTPHEGTNILPSTSPLSTASFLSYDSDEQSSEEPEESDSEWYTREFSKIISLRSPLPPNFPIARPESMAITSDILPLPARRRISKALPPTPLIPRRGSKKRSIRIPKYDPPPVPIVPIQFQNTRPPPRMSLPADCGFDAEHEGVDDVSEFSFAMYEVDYFGERSVEENETPLTPESPSSIYSQPSFAASQYDTLSMHDVKFDVDVDSSMMLPLSLPTTPLDLETDIRMGLEELRTSEPSLAAQAPAAVDDVFMNHSIVSPASPAPSTLSSFSFSTYGSSPSKPHHQASSTYAASYPRSSPYNDESRMLKSKWSTSTLGSIREEHRSPSSKLRLYFGVGGSNTTKHKRGSSSVSTVFGTPSKSPNHPKGGRNLSTGKVPQSPSSPMHLMSPRKGGFRQQQQSHLGRKDSEFGQGRGVRRRGSVTTSVSSCGSDDSAWSGTSNSSSGLRRKPIPMLLFYSGAAEGKSP